VFVQVNPGTLVLLCVVAVELNAVTADHVDPPLTDIAYAYVVICDPPVLSGTIHDNDT
jgi:hypothetical protein